MRFVDEFRDGTLGHKLLERLREKVQGGRALRFMEVCGTHTVAIFRSGLRSVLPSEIVLLSGPGCPVCVTAQRDIDKAMEAAAQPSVVLVTFGDMLKVPGTRGNLQSQRAKGSDIRIVYSPADALKIAEQQPDKKVVFFGIGFETTTPPVALSVIEARRRGLQNYYLLSVHKLIPPALRALLDNEELAVDGFLLPGHVSTIIGAEPYRFLIDEYQMPSVIAGFELLDILQSVHMLADQVLEHRPAVEIQYRRIARPEGNLRAQAVMREVLEPADVLWRGLGQIPGSGLRLREEYAAFDAERVLDLDVSYSREPAGCGCGDVLRGVKTPYDCHLFGKACSPERPVGPCMVSSEGTCYAYYQYGER